MSEFCPDCCRQEEWCTCPMRTQDLVLSVAIVCLAVAFAIGMWLRSTPVEFPPEQQEQGWRPQQPKVPWRRIPPSPPPSWPA